MGWSISSSNQTRGCRVPQQTSDRVKRAEGASKRENPTSKRMSERRGLLEKRRALECSLALSRHRQHPGALRQPLQAEAPEHSAVSTQAHLERGSRRRHGTAVSRYPSILASRNVPSKSASTTTQWPQNRSPSSNSNSISPAGVRLITLSDNRSRYVSTGSTPSSPLQSASTQVG